jgi:hypothetical protein
MIPPEIEALLAWMGWTVAAVSLPVGLVCLFFPRLLAKRVDDPQQQKKIYRTFRVLGTVALVSGIWAILNNWQASMKSGTIAAIVQLADAQQKLEKSPPGVARAEAFVQNLRNIDTSDTPSDLKDAFDAYIDSLESALSEYRAGGSLPASDSDISQAKQQLKAAVLKYADD